MIRATWLLQMIVLKRSYWVGTIAFSFMIHALGFQSQNGIAGIGFFVSREPISWVFFIQYFIISSIIHSIFSLYRAWLIIGQLLWTLDVFQLKASNGLIGSCEICMRSYTAISKTGNTARVLSVILTSTERSLPALNYSMVLSPDGPRRHYQSDNVELHHRLSLGQGVET